MLVCVCVGVRGQSFIDLWCAALTKYCIKYENAGPGFGEGPPSEIMLLAEVEHVELAALSSMSYNLRTQIFRSCRLKGLVTLLSDKYREDVLSLTNP